MRYLIINMLFVCMLFSEKLSNDVRWVVHSNEYKSLCHQIYNHATFQLDQYNDMKENKKLAVIMDLDETVLDNSQYQFWFRHKVKQDLNLLLL